MASPVRSSPRKKSPVKHYVEEVDHEDFGAVLLEDDREDYEHSLRDDGWIWNWRKCQRQSSVVKRSWIW